MDRREEKAPAPEFPGRPPGLAALIHRGGVYTIPGGTSPAAFLRELTQRLILPAGLAAGPLLRAVLEREELMPTAIGQGIALPHPRTPLLESPEDQFVTVAFAERPVDWNSLDGIPVHTALLIVSASARLHLRTLSEINFFCRQESFRALLSRRPPEEDILRAVSEAEASWSGA
ncbi:MAG: PTS sugar transporter subunit IIA [Spirochaetaceae bacterium]|jgi:PTS system nitrogen regulatory IIA component|nr:PTS sugar transporter subunit IIA [Spirochaetaceae bacterium]